MKLTKESEKVLPDHIQAYYDPKSASFWIPAKGGGWTRLRSIGAYLQFNCGIPKEEVALCTLKVQEEHSLIYVGPLAGRRPGVFPTEEGLALVTTGFRLIEPKEGEWPFIKKLLHARLDSQVEHLYVYLKLGYEALREGNFAPGLYLAIVGPPNMHKTCVQELIITPIFGGRIAEPWQFFTSASEFNGDFIGAEHLIITDVDVKGNHKNMHIGSKVKQYCGTSSHRIHPKGREAFQANVIWRISQSCNDSWPHILALPDLSDQTVANKVLLLHFSGVKFGSWMPSDRSKIQARIQEELPCFIHHLVEMKIPLELWGKRFGQTAYKNPTARDKYFSVTHEADLMQIIDEVFQTRGIFPKSGKAEPWEGRTKDLEKILQESSHDTECRRMGATGQMLGKMLHAIAENPSTKARIRITAHANASFYRIFPPNNPT